MISDVDENMSGSIDFGEFLKVVQGAKARINSQNGEEEILDAYVACGGKADKTGHLKKDNLIKIIQQDFGLTINIDDLINTIDGNSSRYLTYSDFKQLFAPST